MHDATSCPHPTRHPNAANRADSFHVCNGGHGCGGRDCTCPCHYGGRAALKQAADAAHARVEANTEERGRRLYELGLETLLLGVVR